MRVRESVRGKEKEREVWRLSQHDRRRASLGGIVRENRMQGNQG